MDDEFLTAVHRGGSAVYVNREASGANTGIHVHIESEPPDGVAAKPQVDARLDVSDPSFLESPRTRERAVREMVIESRGLRSACLDNTGHGGILKLESEDVRCFILESTQRVGVPVQ